MHGENVLSQRRRIAKRPFAECTDLSSASRVHRQMTQQFASLGKALSAHRARETLRRVHVLFMAMQLHALREADTAARMRAREALGSQSVGKVRRRLVLFQGAAVREYRQASMAVNECE